MGKGEGRKLFETDTNSVGPEPSEKAGAKGSAKAGAREGREAE